MSYYRTCPRCGAHLDPGERCDCRDKEEAAQGAANALDGKVDTSDQTVSTSSLHENGRIASMDIDIRERLDLNPSLPEVEAAKAVFLERVRHYAQCADMSRNTLMACALAEVWRQGRRYQRDQDPAALAELAGMGQARPAVTEAAV